MCSYIVSDGSYIVRDGSYIVRDGSYNDIGRDVLLYSK